MIMDVDAKILARDLMHKTVAFEVACANDKQKQARDLLEDIEVRVFELKNRLRKD